MATSRRGKGVVIVSDGENSSRKYTVKIFECINILSMYILIKSSVIVHRKFPLLFLMLFPYYASYAIYM